MTNKKEIIAGIIIIGNEILSGRTQDINTKTISLWLNTIGIKVTEVTIIPDVEKTIIDTVNEFKKDLIMSLHLVVLDQHMMILLLNLFQKLLILNTDHTKKQ